MARAAILNELILPSISYMKHTERGNFIQVEVQLDFLLTRTPLGLSEELQGRPLVHGCFLPFLFVPWFA